MKVKLRPKKKKGRVSYRLPGQLVEQMYELQEKHLPKPHRGVFLNYLVELGIEWYGKDKVPSHLYDQGEPYMLNHLINADTKAVFLELCAAHRPQTDRKDFMAYVVALGIEHYRKLYTVYGVKKVD